MFDLLERSLRDGGARNLKRALPTRPPGGQLRHAATTRRSLPDGEPV